MASHTPDDTTRIVTALRAIVQLLRSGASMANKRAGLSSSQLFIMTKLADVPAPSVNALARRVHAHQSSVSVVVDQLVRQGLVSSVRDTTDRRRRVLDLTPAGRARLKKAPHPVQEALVKAIAALPHRGRHALVRGLEEVATTLGAPVEPALFLESKTRGH